MLVKFSNCAVPIHYLRTGSVVMLESDGEDDMYYNIKHINSTHTACVGKSIAWLVLYNTLGDPIGSDMLVWLGER